MSRAIKVAESLMDVEYQLRNLGLWGSTPPGKEALSSTMPFCVDTLDFHQWLQFVMLPKMQALADQQGPFPTACNITAIAEEVYKSKLVLMSGLIDTLRKLDAAIIQGA